MEQTNEEKLLSSWLHMLMAINGERAVQELSYNEAVICNILIHSEKNMTATDLCQLTKMQKSQMNRTLINMEDKGLIRRYRSEEDHRQVIVKFIEGDDGLYAREHKRILNYIGRLLDKYGKEKADNVVELFETVSKIAQDEEK